MPKSEIKHLAKVFPGMSGKISHSIRMCFVSAMSPERGMAVSLGDLEEAESLCKQFVQAVKEWKEVTENAHKSIHYNNGK